MEESPEVEELVDTRLSLVIGAWSRQPPPVQPLPPLIENEATVGRKKKNGSKKRQHAKRNITVQGGGDDDDYLGSAVEGGGRKKLRLTGEQAALIEDSFRAHNVLSHGEKHDLARQLGLKPRQVEVWYQNRRARTKLKQTELDCELLGRWCERLSDDNARLRQELANAHSSSSSSSTFLSRLTAATTVNAAYPSRNNKPAGGWPGLGLVNRD